MKRYTWINDDVKIDFPIPKILQDKVEELEKMDQEGDYCYFDVCEYLDDDAKEFYVQGKITKTQWDKLVTRYDGSV